MSDLTKHQRLCRPFLARLLIVYGTDAPKVLRRMADELEGVAAEMESEEIQRQPGRQG